MLPSLFFAFGILMVRKEIIDNYRRLHMLQVLFDAFTCHSVHVTLLVSPAATAYSALVSCLYQTWASWQKRRRTRPRYRPDPAKRVVPSHLDV